MESQRPVTLPLRVLVDDVLHELMRPASFRDSDQCLSSVMAIKAAVRQRNNGSALLRSFVSALARMMFAKLVASTGGCAWQKMTNEEFECSVLIA